ncbi:hypothetical protein WMY93_014284 [Mugilogobius chulae]|uniref:Ig-like domain-containing protein n=1 Tax=Mugilogobius chulae TaxID=88201 RepID=A0AAW0NYB1_9GOBI
MLSSLLLSVSCILTIPDKRSFLLYDSVSLRCDDQPDSGAVWRVKRSTGTSGVRSCLSGWGSSEPGSPCLIRNIYPSDIGTYWCENERGERGPSININISASTENFTTAPDFPKSEKGRNVKGNITTAPDFPESEKGETVADSASSTSCALSVLRVLGHVLVSAPYLISTVLLGLIYRDRRIAAKTKCKRSLRREVMMEMQV